VEIAALVHDTGVGYGFLKIIIKRGEISCVCTHRQNFPKGLWPAVAWTAFLHKKKVGEKKLMKTSEGRLSERCQRTCKISP